MQGNLSGNDRILVCIPAFNQAKNIGKVIEAAKKYATEVIVCDDGSLDQTAEVAHSYGAEVIIHRKNRGYGAAVRTLFQTARMKNADVMITIDSDGQHDPNQIPILTQALFQNGTDIVIGSRFLNIKDAQKVPSYRRFGIKTITKFASSATYNDLTDAQSGFRAYGKNALSKIELFESNMSVSTEILMVAKEKNLSVVEVPISVDYEVEGASTHNSVAHGLSVLTSVIRFISVKHPLSFYSFPGVVMILISIGFTNWALEIFSETGFVSTNMIMISVGTAVMGVVTIATGIILYSMAVLIRGKIKYD